MDDIPTVRIRKPMVIKRTPMREAVPEYIPPEGIAVARTSSDDLTKKMYSIDHRMARIDGPPDMVDGMSDFDVDTDVDVMIVDMYE
jgi:hypothetical protein